MGFRVEMEKYFFLEEEYFFIAEVGEFGLRCIKLVGFVVGRWMSLFLMIFIFLMKYEFGLLVGGGCVGGLRKKEMIWYSYFVKMEKFNRIFE